VIDESFFSDNVPFLKVCVWGERAKKDLIGTQWKCTAFFHAIFVLGSFPLNGK
jgi:hypothetical protein